jgi:hypothetical protein
MTDTGSTPAARAREVQSPFEQVERAVILTAVRAADHPWVVPVADLTLRCQSSAWRTFRRATTYIWHSSGMPTYDEFGLLGEQLSAVRHRLPRTSERGGAS